MSETETETPETAEPEAPDSDEEEEAQEQEEAQPSGPTEAEQAAEEQARFDKEYEAANKAHRRRLERLTGMDLAEHVCESCKGVGYLPPGSVPEIPLLFKPNTVACSACNGYGSWQTPSKAANHQVVTCTTCAGYGYVDQPAPSNVQQFPTTATTTHAPSGLGAGVMTPTGFQPFGSEQIIPYDQLAAFTGATG